MTGFVYAIGDGRGRVKIGWSADPVRRLNKIGSDCPTKATLLGLIQATKAQEHAAHELLAAWRVNREWFLLEGAVLDFVAALPQPRPRAVNRKEPREGDHPLTAWRKKNEYTLASFGAALGTSHVTVSRWEQGHRIPTRRYMARIQDLTGIAPTAFYSSEAAQ
jgi:hypothetical protein